MGKATILSEGVAEGAYTVQADFGSEIIASRVATLQDKADALQVSIEAKEAERLAALASSLEKSSLMSTAITAYRLKLLAEEDATEELKAVTAAQAVLTGAQFELDRVESQLEALVIRKSAVEDRITYLNGLNLQQTVDTWCVDYTLEASGEVATIEIPGEPAKILVAPGASPPTVADGTVLARPVMDSKELYYNLAILPGWQKFKPTYRVGELVSIDYATETGSVVLDVAQSTAQNLNINQSLFLENVPIEYMDCGGSVFETGDRVVVKFESQDWSQPKIIGFESNPRPCWDAVGRLWEEWVYLDLDNAIWSVLNLSSRSKNEELVALTNSTIDILSTEPYDAPKVFDFEVYVKEQNEEAWTQLYDVYLNQTSASGPTNFSCRYRESGVNPRKIFELRFALPDPRPGEFNFPEPFRFVLTIFDQYLVYDDPPGEIPIAIYRENLPGIYECFVRKVSTGEALLHIAVDFQNRGVKAFTTQFIDPIQILIRLGFDPIVRPLEGFSAVVLDYDLSPPPE